MNSTGSSASISVVWLSHDQAKLIHFSDDRMERGALHPPDFNAIARSLGAVRRVLILGPDAEKTRFLTWLRENRPELAARVVGCESSEQPGDVQIAGHVTRYFARLA